MGGVQAAERVAGVLCQQRADGSRGPAVAQPHAAHGAGLPQGDHDAGLPLCITVLLFLTILFTV